MIRQFIGHAFDEFTVKIYIHIPTQLKEDKPIPDVAPIQDKLQGYTNLFIVFVADPVVEKIEANGFKEEGAHSIEEKEGRGEDAKDQVEPEHEVHLLVDDVLGEDTKTVVPLFVPGGTDRWHITTDHFGESGAKRTDGKLTFRFRERIPLDHPPTITNELTLEEHVGGPDVEEEQDKVHKFADEKVDEVFLIVMKKGAEVFDKFLHHHLHHDTIVIFSLLREHHYGFALCAKRGYKATFKGSPNTNWDHEETRLKELHERDPLIIGGVRGLLFPGHPFQVRYTVHMGLILRRYITGTVDPAVIFGCLSIDSFEVALNGLAKVLAHHTHHGSGKEQDHTSFRVEFEVPVVNVCVLKHKVFGDVLNQMRHELLWFSRSLEKELFSWRENLERRSEEIKELISSLPSTS